MRTTTTSSKHTMHVMVVGGGPDVLPRVEPLLPAGGYDVEFVGLDQEPYGCITDDPPDLLVVCLRIEDAAGFQFLSMLQMDPYDAPDPGAHLHDRGGGSDAAGRRRRGSTPLHITAQRAQAGTTLML